MTYLSRLQLNLRHREVQRWIVDCQQLHCAILSAFPDDAPTGSARHEFGVLHRLEIALRPKPDATLLVQSGVMPDWSALPAVLAPSSTANPAVKEIDRFYDAIEDGSTLVFRLRANPTKRVRPDVEGQDTKRHGKRVDIRREEDQLAWLSRKAEASGFELVGARVRPDDPNVLVAPQDRTHGWHTDTEADKKRRLTFGAVLFDGQLRVSNACRFREALRAGIGSGKAYGFGLLSVAPLKG